ncbi:caspase family protein [Streptomyces harbinensis]|uniref:caspase family protein n=1 Tax=Streptomyces harbinensis TaxID=1176198 RepID=UPI003394D84E
MIHQPRARRSRVVLIGVSEYDRGTGFPSLPSVLANIEQLYDVLVDDAYGRFTPEVVRTLRSPDRETLVREAARAAGEAEDLLLCYFSGHGCLYTSEPAQGPGRLYPLPRAGGGPGAGTGAYGLGYAELRDLLCAGRAERVVLVLDCCYSGNALLEPLPEDRAFALLTSSRRFPGQSAGDGSGPTPFTAALLEVLRGGGDGEDERGPVTVEALAEPLRRRAERDAERARGEADSDPDDWHPELHNANEAGNTVLSQAVRLPCTSRARRLARTVRARRDRLWARARARPVRAAGALGGQSLAVPAGSARAADAERLIRFLTAEPGSRRRLAGGGVRAGAARGVRGGGAGLRGGAAGGAAYGGAAGAGGGGARAAAGVPGVPVVRAPGGAGAAGESVPSGVLAGVAPGGGPAARGRRVAGGAAATVSDRGAALNNN